MTIVERQVQPLRELKESLKRNGITRFNSIAEIKRFLSDFESEKECLPDRVEQEVDNELQEMRSTLLTHQHLYDDLKTNVRNELKRAIRALKGEIENTIRGAHENPAYRIFCYIKIKWISRKRAKLEKNFAAITKKRTKKLGTTVSKLRKEFESRLENRAITISHRCNIALDNLTHTKAVIDDLDTLIAGSIGESAVARTLQELSDEYYLINDYSAHFNPPIFRKQDNERIFSVQIDHLLVCPSGVFILETKNWSRRSIDNLDLRSPVDQVRRNNFALFILLNSDSKAKQISLEKHHWGAKKIPVRNIIVMINQKPNDEFQHVKVLSLNELVGYIQYFDQTFNGNEVRRIFEYLKEKM